MKKLGLILLLLAGLYENCFSQGSTCGTAYTLTLDGICRQYAISSSVDNNALCPGSGNHPITFFSFTTNATADPVLLDIQTPGGQACEVAMYTGCNSNPQGYQSASSMCFADGQGLWAVSQTFTLAPNTTYYLRILTQVTGNITICGKYYVPTNNYCSGARAIGPVAISDNNATHKPTSELLPEDLCAWTLENTAFYVYTVENTGVSTIVIENISCDNGVGNNVSGFQIGFFTGTCGALTKQNCVEGSGSILYAPTNSLPAGTKVYVAIDGINGSNCSYTISASNAVLLSVQWKYFTGWKINGANRLRWATSEEIGNAYFDIERSADGTRFIPVGQVKGSMKSDVVKEYVFEDRNIRGDQYYRLKQVTSDGHFSYSDIVVLKDEDQQQFSFQNVQGRQLNYQLRLQKAEEIEFQVFDRLGRQLMKHKQAFYKGANNGQIDISNLQPGYYYLSVLKGISPKVYSFIK